MTGQTVQLSECGKNVFISAKKNRRNYVGRAVVRYFMYKPHIQSVCFNIQQSRPVCGIYTAPVEFEFVESWGDSEAEYIAENRRLVCFLNACFQYERQKNSKKGE